MARFYQAPVVQPVDYGYDMPFEHLYGALQMEQQKQDQVETAAKNLYDVGELNALKQDFGRRNALINNRYDEVDNILYDQNGNRRDLRNMMGDVQKEARRRAVEEQAGGEWYSIQASYDNAQAYKEELKKMHDEGDITSERRRALEQYSLNVYGGIGEPDEFGEYNIFRGVDAARELDDQQVAYDAVKDTAFNKLQSAGIFDQNGMVIATEDRIQQALTDPIFKDMGDFIQTGSLEFRTLEMLKYIGAKDLMLDEDLRQDIYQEAFLKGLTTPEQQYTYWEQKIDVLTTTAAEKYASAKFSPQVRDDWRAKKRQELSNGKALIDYEKTKEMQSFEYNTRTNSFIFKPGEALNKVAATNAALEAKRNQFEDKYMVDGKIRTDLNDVELEQMKQAQFEMRQMELSKWHDTNALTRINDRIVSEGGQDIRENAVNQLVTTMFGDKSPSEMSEGEREVFNELTLYASRKDATDFILGLQDGSMFKDPEFVEMVSNLNEEYGEELGKTFGAEGDLDLAYNELTGVNDAKRNMISGILIGTFDGKELGNNIVNNFYSDVEDYELDYDVVTRTTAVESNSLGQFNEAATNMVRNGDGNLMDTRGQSYDIYTDVEKQFPGGKVKNIKVQDVRDNHQANDALGMILVTAEVTDRNGNVHSYSRQVTGREGSQTNQTILENKMAMGFDKIAAATAEDARMPAVDLLEQGSNDVGQVIFAGTGLDNAQNLRDGETMALSRPGDTVPQGYIKKVEGGYMLGYTQVQENPDGTIDYYEPNWGNINSQSEDFLFDTRDWTGSSDKFIFNSLSDIKQTVGFDTYLKRQEHSEYKNPSNTR